MADFLRGRARRRMLVVVLALWATQLGSLVAPAYACGCGAMVPDTARRVAVAREVSVVRWDGRRERIVMRLTVAGDSDRAAWIMPVPHRADVTLGDPALFDELDKTTAPVHRTRTHFWPQDGDWPLVSGGGRDTGAPPPGVDRAPGVAVVGRQKLGPFDVARLTATDPAALGDWLADHGFSLPPRLSAALQPYVARRWEYVAIRLAPDTTGTPLRGILDPLSLSFAADEPVYPMRLSRLARTPQSLGLYVLAAHRMQPASAIGGSRPRVTFAGRITPPRNSPLAELAAGTPFLTAIGQEFPTPSLIDGDHTLRRTATDTPFQQVIYEDRLRTVAGIPAWLLTVAVTLAALTAAVALFAVRRTTAEPMDPQAG
ncbi:uncharacterized protein DUF2330 [Streptomyces sp. TLI_55]|uniref:DUF2330 domain-containing protein n=1 Tax=Streptomyces sp. TLI_55 TaxID=1938861 RepID=UPI000BDA04A1|nr:DUF2330 domain-containing protein [Streptomyces sp. TLI_55]SNX58122.1 uncharacterized protein DUF2330 [Streptomyces sp. TLI_55]